jgi:hypothetical protein
VDEHSIKVDGTGSAIITDIKVELLPNRDIFQEIYPDSDSDSDKEESEEDADDHDTRNAALEEVREELVGLDDQRKRAKEALASAESRLKFLDAHGSSIDAKSNVDIVAGMETYRTEREKVFQDHMAGIARDRDVAKAIAKVRLEEARLLKLQAKEEKKAAKEKAKLRRARERVKEKQRRRDEEQNKEKARIRKEREQFWPRSCYTVRISLDAGADYTPGSSRRSSIASAADVQLVSDKAPKGDEAAATMACDLTLSYVTSSAFWAPSYDLTLSSTTNTAMLSFDASLTNMTSETWANSKVILSTSQASFSGLQDDTPVLVPWRLKIYGRNHVPFDGQDIAHSQEERTQKQVRHAAQNAVAEHKSRAGLFGVSQPLQQLQPQFNNGSMQPQQQMQMQQMLQFTQQRAQAQAQAQAQAANAARPQASLFGSANNANIAPTGSSLFGSTAPAPPTGSFGRSARSRETGTQDEAVRDGLSNSNYGMEPGREDDEADAQTMLDPTPEITYEDSAFEETGLTATYDLPHLKTLQPSSSVSKQRVARISFTNVTFARTVVAKYKPAAYLRARLRNTSKLTLLKGPTGLTLDGSFLGRSTLPRCSAGDTFNIPLGVDPAIKVAYPKPDIARSTTGVFSKGENSVYTRTITLINTRATAGTPVGVTVLDQVPVSEDERLRVEVLQPAGTQGGTRIVTAGVPGKPGKEESEWGRATASLKKAGEVEWAVVLNAGKSVKLLLQYEVAFPTGERVGQVYG